MKIGILIQARLSSTRLPGKVLFKLGDTNHCSISLIKERLLSYDFKYDTEIAILTTNNDCDEAIKEFALENNLKFYRGSENNVLERYILGAENFGFNLIVRITSDCPFVDPDEINKLIEFYLNNNYEYVTNSFDGSTVIDGCDVEVFSLDSLKRINNLKPNEKEREHVTLKFLNEKNSNTFFLDPLLNYPYTRLTLDTPADYKAINMLLKFIDNPVLVKMEEIACLYHSKDIFKINGYIERNSGWNK
tara:strand:- start:3736 stop:4476 length:741 start_codon:yes stop_codon:yes gene_type:complete